MDEQRRIEAFKYIESQLENGYIDLGINEQDEIEIVKEAIKMLKFVDEFNSIGCTSFSFAYNPEVREIFKEDVLNDRIEKMECSIEDFKRLGYTDEEAEELYKHINIYI